MDAEPLVAVFVGDLERVIDKYRGQGITVSEAIGALEIVKLNIYHGCNDGEED